MKKKLIEVALPLEAINKASAREKSIRHGHPSTLHLWWARRPLAAARAVIFAQLVDDPSANPDLFPTEKKQERERQRLFKIIEDLVLWENTTNEKVLQAARDEIWKSWRRTCEARREWRGARSEKWAPEELARDEALFNPDRLPAFHDPFAGGGSLPLEAQRLGLEAYASDLNPVAVLICKAMIEIPPRFAGLPPVNPEARQDRSLIAREWRGAQGLAEDVRYYGKWMRDEAERRIGHLYPKVKAWRDARSGRYFGDADVEEWRSSEARGERSENGEEEARACGHPSLSSLLSTLSSRQLTVIAWLWARTVKSPNPAFANVDVPLASTFMLSTKPGKEAYVEVVREEGRGEMREERGERREERGERETNPLTSHSSSLTPHPYRFTVKVGKPKDAEAAKNGTKLARGANFKCVMSGAPIAGDYIKAEGRAGRMGARLMAIVAEGSRGRVYLPPTPEHEAIARQAKPEWKPEGDVPARLTGGTCVPYGLAKWGDLFTPRQLVALTTFADLVQEARERVRADAIAAGLPDDGKPLRDGGTGATAYAEAVGVYLALAASRAADAWSTIVSWRNGVEATRGTFARQALPMVWDYAEANPFSDSCGNWSGACLEWVSKATAAVPATASGGASHSDAASQTISLNKLVSTDPPYYDNIGYADLSDFFYVWLRRSLKSIFPDLFATLAVPKAEELVATPYRHGSKEAAEEFFLEGMFQALRRLAELAHPAFPVTIYYAFKQAESDDEEGTASTGWETFLDAVIRAGFAISGTWPIRTERGARSIGIGTNALASSIVLVCRKRPADAPVATRREFVAALKAELPQALAELQKANIAPVDLAQAAIGPGMAVYTRYAKVLDAQGKAMTVREALALINQTLDEALAEQEGDFDADSRWALAWFEQHGFDAGEFGVAETLSKAKNTSVAGMAEAGIVESKRGKVRLLKPAELSTDWDPMTDPRLTAWEMVHHLIRALESGGESAAAELVAKLGARAEVARELAYRLYVMSERKKRAQEALSYNGLVQSWPEIARLAREGGKSSITQEALFEESEA